MYGVLYCCVDVVRGAEGGQEGGAEGGQEGGAEKKARTRERGKKARRQKGEEVETRTTLYTQ